MKIGSNAAVMTAPASVTFMARRASPTARSSDAKHMPAARSGSEGEVMVRKPSARRRVSPAAPSRSRIGPRATTVPTPITAETPSINTRLAAAMRRASSSRPAPITREATAPTPMVSPIETEVWKNPTTPANPIAAAIGRCPSSEM